MNNDKEKDSPAVAVPAAPTRPWAAWLAVVLALAAWAALMWSDGYVALAVGVVAAVIGCLGAHRNTRGLRRISVAAVIASLVLVAVVAAFLIVIKIGLGS